MDSVNGIQTRIRQLPIANDMKKNGLDACASLSMQLYFLLGNYEKAVDCFNRISDKPMGILEASVVYQSRLFYFALISIEIHRQKGKAGQRSETNEYVDRVKQLVEGGAINLGHKYLLLQAELASLTSKDHDDTMKKYEQAISSSARAGFLQDGALASMLCGRFCLRESSLKEKADFHMIRAHELFCAWGATAIATNLTTGYPDIFPDGMKLTQKESSSLRSRPHFKETIILKHKSICN